MRDLNDLYYFTQVVEYGGFSAAGRALGLPKSKLSRRVAQLEDSLGVRLLQRSSRRFALTEMGQAYYRHCRAMVVEAEAAEEVIEHSQAEPQGTIRLSCPVTLVQVRLGRLAAAFLAEYPKVRIHIDATNRRVDLIEEGIDIAFRVRKPPLEDSGLIIKVLEQDDVYLVGAPSLLDQYGRPQILEELSNLPSLGMTRAGDRHFWQFAGPEDSRRDVVHYPRLVTDDMVALLDAARAGIGIVQLPALMVEADLIDGRLERILPGWEIPQGLIHAVFPSRRGLVPAVRLFLDFLGKNWARS